MLCNDVMASLIYFSEQDSHIVFCCTTNNAIFTCAGRLAGMPALYPVQILASALLLCVKGNIISYQQQPNGSTLICATNFSGANLGCLGTCLSSITSVRSWPFLPLRPSTPLTERLPLLSLPSPLPAPKSPGLAKLGRHSLTFSQDTQVLYGTNVTLPIHDKVRSVLSSSLSSSSSPPLLSPSFFFLQVVS